jgi:hypothetical protein
MQKPPTTNDGANHFRIDVNDGIHLSALGPSDKAAFLAYLND